MPDLTTISSDKSERAIKVGKVIYLPDLPEYPETSEEGVVYLVNTANMSTEDVDLLCENVGNPLLIDYKYINNILASVLSQANTAA